MQILCEYLKVSLVSILLALTPPADELWRRRLPTDQLHITAAVDRWDRQTDTYGYIEARRYRRAVSISFSYVKLNCTEPH